MRNWKKRRQSAQEWARQIASGQLLEDARKEPFSASESVLVERAPSSFPSTKNGPAETAVLALVSVGAEAREIIPGSAPKKWREKYGRFALGWIEAADWEGESPKIALGWILAAGAYGKGAAAVDLLRERFSEEQIGAELAESARAFLGRPWVIEPIVRGWMGALGSTRILSIWGTSKEGKATLEEALAPAVDARMGMHMGMRKRWSFVADLIEAAPTLADWLRSEEMGRGRGGLVGKRLRKSMKSFRTDEDVSGIETVLAEAMKGLSGTERHLWALETEEIIKSAIEKKSIQGFEAANRLLERAIMGESVPGASARRKARSV